MNSKILKYSRVEGKRFANMVINKAIYDTYENKNINKDDLIIIKKNDENIINMIDVNTNEINLYIKDITKNIEKELVLIEEGNVKNLNLPSTLKNQVFKNRNHGIIYEIPIRSIYSNSLLSNTGPIIPMKLLFIGKVYTKISTDIKPYGINSVYIQIDLDLEVTEKISLPRMTEDLIIKKKIPIIMKIIQGVVPDYYNDNNYTLPNSK